MKTIFVFGSLLIMILLNVGCSLKEDPTPPDETPSFIHRDGILVTHRMETTPFVWGYEVLYMVSARDYNRIEIYNQNGVLRTSTSSTLKLASAIVNSGTLYVIGTTVDNSELLMVSTTDLYHWTQPVQVMSPVQNIAYFNNSVAKDNTGFIMALETCEPNTVCFNARFFKSQDLIHWSPVGGVMAPSYYAACPTIRYINGEYYVFYLARSDDYFVTRISRTVDFINFDISPKLVVSTTKYESSEGKNASDLDLVEFNGEVYITFADGDQKDWSDVLQASYNGTMSQFVQEFF